MRRTTHLMALLVVAGTLAVAWTAWSRPVRRDRLAPVAVEHRIDLNTADAPTLALLPGLGMELARRVVEHREPDRPFQSEDDLLRVPGIGPGKLEALRPYVTCGDVAEQPAASAPVAVR